MRNNTLLSILASSSLFAGACVGQDRDVADNGLLGLGDNDCGDHDGGSCNDDDHDGDGDDGGGGDGGGGDDIDVDLEVDLDAHASIEIVGTALWLGLDLGCLDLSGEFTASYDAMVHFESDDDTWRISSVNDASLEIEDDCQCSNDGLDIQAMTSITAHVKLEADENSCNLYCDAWADTKADAECSDHDDSTSCHAEVWADAHAVCSTTCDASDGWIMAHADLATSLDIDLDSGDGDELEGDLLDLEFDDLLDSDGNVIDLD